MQAQTEKTNLEFYILDDNKLKPGDIILTTTSQKLSKIIKSVTGGEFSHAMLYVGGQSCIDSTGNGVQSHNTQRLLFPSPEFCKVLRHQDSLSDDKIELITFYVRGKVGTAYSIPEAIQAGIKVRDNIKELNRQFCSRLVSQAYHNAGLPIVKNADYPSPEDINNSEKLITVENALKLAGIEEIAIANEKDTPINRQEQSTNFIFKKTQELTGQDIQTLDQLNGMLIYYPQYDEQVLGILINSGYLDLWKNDLEINPWFYDYSIFEQHCTNKQQRQEIGRKQTLTEKSLRNIFQINYERLLDAFKVRPLKSLLIQVTLYQQLIKLSDKRMDVWTQAMK